MESYKNEFSNNEITVSFEPCKCVHAEKCAQELSDVFSTSIIPWINLDGIETKRIINQIKKCPSGALTYRKNTSKQAS
ncbi:(4Fe-4S)-binding protein [Mariniflexile soesokkakense]|uniref:(4Fe-4S)-binding protein n=1 Tax=Mariniflexile soesokkakense TaxID=1343160 RepID=A0ABV0A9M6_9FLAO